MVSPSEFGSPFKGVADSESMRLRGEIKPAQHQGSSQKIRLNYFEVTPVFLLATFSRALHS